MRMFMVLFLAAVVGLGFTGVAMARGGHQAQGTHQAQKAQGEVKMPRLLSQLDLTDAQKTSIMAILTKAKADARAATDKSAKREIRKTAHQAILAVLTDAQRQKLQELKKQTHHGRRAGGHGKK